MATPLYKDAPVPVYRPAQANCGLWYDKFCNTWTDDFSGFQKIRNEEGKKIWIDQMSRPKARVGDEALLTETHERRTVMLEKCSGTSVTAVTGSSFASGLGRSHPVENGFCWHHTLGVPYLPGSSVKGVVRSWAVLNKKSKSKPEGSVTEEEINRILGPRGKDVKTNVGSVIFIDALPTKPVQLKTEIMTPHYGPWYQDIKAPGDWHNPTPIQFLAVAVGQNFSFGIMPRNLADKSDCEQAIVWLKKALEEHGAGAKTSVMGWFDIVKCESNR